jgi:hypothetical protein
VLSQTLFNVMVHDLPLLTWSWLVMQMI